MAKASFNFALESLIKVVVQETNLLLEAGFQVQLFCNNLERLQRYIQNSGPSNDKNIILHKQIRDAAHEAEDLINKFALKVAWYKRRSRMGKILHSAEHGIMLRNTPKKIKRIQTKVDEIFSSKEKLKIERSRSERSANEDENAGTMPNPDVNFINFTDDIARLEGLLTDNEPRRCVISIVGMGGSGKTALAMKLCERIREKDYFSRIVLVTLKQRTTLDDILRKIISKLAEQQKGVKELGLIKAQVLKKKEEYDLSGDLQRLDYGELKKKLLLYIKGKRYLIVIDNIWESRFCGPLLEAFPDDSNSSRIIITTRRKGVANSANSSIHFIPELNDAHGSQLFCRVVFWPHECPVYLEEPKNKVVRISYGLPMVIVGLGNVLANIEQKRETWNKFIDNENSYPDDGRKLWRDRFASTYDQIEINKKFCFFYFGSFPANYDIPVRQLIQLWIAEDFIVHNPNTTLERIAEEYMEELIEKCLIQPTSWRLDGGAKTCRIHNVLRDLCLYESKMEEFLEVIHDGSDLSSYSKPRRLSLHRKTLDFIRYSSSNKSSVIGCNISSARSLLCFGKDGSDHIQKDHWKWLCKRVRMLRVLKLGDGQVESIPKRIRKLYLLKYLKLTGDNLTELPDSICELLDLVTLDLRGSSVNRLPDGIWELQNLRHLYISQPTKLPSPSDDSRIFPSLQILSWLALDQDIINLIVGGRLPLVKKLGLCTEPLRHQITPDVLAKIHGSLSHLERLKIRAPLSEQPTFVWSLVSDLKFLKKITLVECEVNFTLLKDLPELQYLKVHKGRTTDNDLVSNENSFAKLLAFQMTEFPIKNWKIFQGAMPRLERLIIKGCEVLQVRREELQFLTMLRKLHVHRPCREELYTIVQQMKTNHYMGNRCYIQLFD